MSNINPNEKRDVLVALLLRKNSLEILKKEGWHHIPVNSPAEKRIPPRMLAFYQGKSFGEEAGKIRYFGDVEEVEKVPRKTIHVRAMRPERDALEIQFPRVEGYRVELPGERLQADFNEDSTLVLTPILVGPSITRNAGIIGEDVDLNLKHLEDMRPSTLLFHLTSRLLYKHYRDPDEEPEMHLFGQLTQSLGVLKKGISCEI